MFIITMSNSGHFANSISEVSAIDGIRIANCSPQIADSTIINNGNDGLYASGSGAATVTGNTFTGNGRHGVYLNQTAIPPNISGNTGSGNGTNGVVLAGYGDRRSKLVVSSRLSDCAAQRGNS